MKKSKKFIFIYKTTDLINSKIYIGVHGTNKLNDGYIGSGNYLKIWIKKHGKENFEREILYWFDSYEEAYEKEKKIVNEKFIMRKDTYNLCGGGHGGSFHSEESKQKISKNCKGMTGKKHSEETKRKIREKALGRKHSNETKRYLSDLNKGKKLSDETKKKISEGNKGKITSQESIDKRLKSSKGFKHSKESIKKMSEIHSNMSKEWKDKIGKWRTGRKLVNKMDKTKWIKQKDIDIYLNDGWSLGRK